MTPFWKEERQGCNIYQNEQKQFYNIDIDKGAFGRNSFTRVVAKFNFSQMHPIQAKLLESRENCGNLMSKIARNVDQ